MFDFRLKVFRSVAHNLSFTKASQELYVSQPAVSRHIHELESIFRVQLFERNGGHIMLTEAGKLLLKHCERILDAYESLTYEMSVLNRCHEGVLPLGASTTVAQYVLPPLMAKFVEQFPKISLSLISGNSREVEAALLSHRIHLGLVEGLARNPDLYYTPFLKDELVGVVGSKNPLTDVQQISLEEFKQTPLVLRENGSGTLDVIIRSLTEHDIKLSDLNIRLHLGSTESIKGYLENSNCMGIVSIRAVRREVYDGRLKVIDIEGLKMQRDFNLVQRCASEEGLSTLFSQFLLRNDIYYK